MDAVETVEPVETTEAAPDISGMAERIGNELFPAKDTTGSEPEAVETPAPPVAETVAPPPTVRSVPKSWPTEMHEHWGKIDPKVQEYWETREKQMLEGLDQYKQDAAFAKSLRDVVTPYKPILQAAGIDEVRAVQTLLNAHYRLTQGSPESRKSAYEELGRQIGLITEPAAPVDPQVAALQNTVQTIQQQHQAMLQAQYQEKRAVLEKEIEAFAADKTHPYFEEVADDIIVLLKAGKPLQEAYDKAVWANPVTRAKEQARLLQEHEAKLKENARLEALPKKKAKGVNIESRDAGRAPTEPLGSLEDTIKQVHQEIKSRVH